MNMIPCSPTLNVANSRATDAKTARDFVLCSIGIENSHRSSFTDYRFTAVRASWLIVPALLIAVPHIVGNATEKKVIWVYAGRIIALVADALTFTDQTFSQNEGNSMGQRHEIPGCAEPSIPVLVSVGRPNPAMVGSRHLLVKAFAQGFHVRQIGNIVDVHYGSFHERLCMACSALTRWKASFYTMRK